MVSDPPDHGHFSPDLCHSVALGQPSNPIRRIPVLALLCDVGVHALCYHS